MSTINKTKRMTSILCLFMILSSQLVNAESNVNRQVILDKKALISFAKSNKSSKKNGDHLESLLTTVGTMWTKYDSSQSEENKVALAGKITRTIGRLIEKNHQWERSLGHEKSMVQRLLESSKDMPRNSITIDSLNSETRAYAKGLFDIYTDSLSPDQKRLTEATGRWSATTEVWRKRALREGKRSSVGAGHGGIYTRQDMIQKISSLESSMKVSNYMEKTFSGMLFILDINIKNGALKSVNESHGFIDSAQALKVAGEKITTPSGGNTTDDSVTYFNPYD